MFKFRKINIFFSYKVSVTEDIIYISESRIKLKKLMGYQNVCLTLLAFTVAGKVSGYIYYSTFGRMAQ